MEKIKKASLILTAICLTLGIWKGANIGLTMALFFLGVSEFCSAIVYHRNKKKGLALSSLCLGLFAYISTAFIFFD